MIANIKYIFVHFVLVFLEIEHVDTFDQGCTNLTDVRKNVINLLISPINLVIELNVSVFYMKKKKKERNRFSKMKYKKLS